MFAAILTTVILSPISIIPRITWFGSAIQRVFARQTPEKIEAGFAASELISDSALQMQVCCACDVRTFADEYTEPD